MSRPRRDGPAQGVTPELRAEVLRLRRVPVTRVGLTYREISEKLGVPQATVYRIAVPRRRS